MVTLNIVERKTKIKQRVERKKMNLNMKEKINAKGLIKEMQRKAELEILSLIKKEKCQNLTRIKENKTILRLYFLYVENI